MYLSDRELREALETGRLIVDPPPAKIDPTSIDLRLDTIEEARVWNMVQFQGTTQALGYPDHELHIGRFDFRQFAKYLMAPPADPTAMVFRRGSEIIIKPGGFLLWQTKERVGTPRDGAELICFVNGKSTRARTGLVVHMTAPTIHASWNGNIALEIANHGPFHFVLEEDDVIAQLTVATISSVPTIGLEHPAFATEGQRHVSGASD